MSCYIPNIKALGLMDSDKKIFPRFSLYKLGAGHFLPQGHHLNKLCRGQLVDATYQISRL